MPGKFFRCFVFLRVITLIIFIYAYTYMYICIYVILCAICCHFYKLKNEENNHEGVLFLVKLHATTLLKVTLLYGFFSRFWSCINGTKSHSASHIIHKWSKKCLADMHSAVYCINITLLVYFDGAYFEKAGHNKKGILG